MVAPLLLAALLALGPVAAQQTAESALLVHVPVVQGVQDQPIHVVVALSDMVQADGLRLWYRSVGEGDWEPPVDFERLEGDDWRATIPAQRVTPPGVEYYIASSSGPQVGDRYASASTPQRVEVPGKPGYARMQRELARYEGQRSVFSLQGDFLSFGSSGAQPDHYRLATFDYRYRVLGTIRSLHFGFSSLRAAQVESDGGRRQYGAGVDYGFAEIELGFREVVGLSGCLQLGANTDGFVAGGAGTVRIGHEPGTHATFMLGYLAGVGERYELTLAWNTVPRIPMGASLWVADWPDYGDLAIGVRYQAVVPLGQHADLALRLGYQARSSELGGLAGGLGFSWAF